MKIDAKTLGEGRCYIVAELSANHNHSIELAKQTILMAKEAGADAVKLQTYTPDTITIDCDAPCFQITQGTIWDGTTLYRLYQTAYTPFEWHRELFAYARQIGITIFSTPFDRTAVDLLESMDTPAYKIASFEINDIPLITYAAAKGKPMILSTGVAAPAEISEALDACRRAGNNDIMLLKCTSSYPTPYEQVNLHTMNDLRRRYGVAAGLSDHTLGTAVSVAAAALGADLLERHVILDRALGGPDASFSLDQAELTALVRDIRAAEAALGSVCYDLTEKQKNSKEHSRSLFVTRDIAAGETLSADNVRSIRPAFGMHTRYYNDILGKTAVMDLPRGTPLRFNHLKVRVYILTEGGRVNGLGHITRCAALYEALAARGLQPVFWLEGDDDIAAQALARQGYAYVPVRWTALERLAELQGQLCIVDSYKVSGEALDAIAGAALRCLYVDDHNRHDYPPGAVVHPSLLGAASDTEDRPGVRYYSGEDYVILRPPFCRIFDKSIREEIRKVLVVMGGTDAAQLTPRVLNGLKSGQKPPQIHVVLGPGAASYPEIQKRAQSGECILHENLSAIEMAGMILDSDLVVSAGGQTSYELVQCRTPTILVQAAENQRRNIQEMAEKGLALALKAEELPLLSQTLDGLTAEKRRTMSSKMAAYDFSGGAARAAGILLGDGGAIG